MKRKQEKEIDLSALFESAIALEHAWLEFSQGLDRFTFRALRTDPANDDSLRKENPERYEQISKGWLPTTWESRQKKLELRTRDERGYLLDGIYRGDRIAIGFRTLPDGSDELIRVPRQHCFVDYELEDPFPNINWKKGELRVGTESYFDIRIVKSSESHIQCEGDSVEDTRARKGRPNTSEQIRTAPADSENVPKLGRPSNKNLILAAVAEHAKSDPALVQPKHERFNAYRTYISEMGYEPLRDSGFSDKTLEKFETEFRRQIQ